MNTEKPLVSIIIPTFNRAHLIGETLDSVLAQTYQNWECIVVDDGSTDNTTEVVEGYVNRDARFQYHHRPVERLKGANACRNYGFELSKGEYVNWFDDDDVMLEEFITYNIQIFKNKSCDISISRFSNFYNLKNILEEVDFNKNLKTEINGINYLKHLVFFGTINVVLKRDVIGEIRFNELLKSGQEYNFFSKLFLTKKPDIFYSNKINSLRRLHNDSIQKRQFVDNQQYLINKQQVYYQTYLDLKKSKEIDSVKNYLLKKTAVFTFNKSIHRLKSNYLNIGFDILKELGFLKYFYYSLSITFGFAFKRGYKFIVLFKKGIQT